MYGLALRQIAIPRRPFFVGRRTGTRSPRIRNSELTEVSRFERESKSLPDESDLLIVYLVDLY